MLPHLARHKAKSIRKRIQQKAELEKQKRKLEQQLLHDEAVEQCTKALVASFKEAPWYAKFI